MCADEVRNYLYSDIKVCVEIHEDLLEEVKVIIQLRVGKVWDGLGYGLSIPYHGMVWYRDHII